MNRKKTMKREYQAYLYILPWILGFVILQLYPFVSSFIYSFTDYTVGAKATFQGLANYKKLFTQDKEFWNSLKVTILFALYTVPGKLIMALAVAMFLNRDLKGINLIRAFPGMGIRVWGARTVSSDPSWKYINVRRLFIFIEESIKANTNWAVFEPNDEVLWVRVKRTIDVFLTGMWRGGSLAGSVPSEAFFVNIGRDTMSQDDIDNEIGRASCRERV